MYDIFLNTLTTDFFREPADTKAKVDVHVLGYIYKMVDGKR